MSDEGEPPAAGKAGRPRASPFVRWGLAGGVAVFVALLITVIAGNRGPELPPRTVQDQEFVRRANAACERVLPPLREDRQRRARSGEEAAVRRSMERAADELERLAGEVRAIPVAADDQADVGRWLGDWDAYVDVGRRFADALGRRDDDSYGPLAAESSRLSERIFAFSQANGVRECVF